MFAAAGFYDSFRNDTTPAAVGGRGKGGRKGKGEEEGSATSDGDTHGAGSKPNYMMEGYQIDSTNDVTDS